MHSRHTHDVDLITKIFHLFGWLGHRRLAHHLDWQDDVRVLEALVHGVVVVACLGVSGVGLD